MEEKHLYLSRFYSEKFISSLNISKRKKRLLSIRFDSLPQTSIVFREDTQELLENVEWRKGQRKIAFKHFKSGDCFFATSSALALEGRDFTIGFPYKIVGFIFSQKLYVLRKI